MKRQSPAGWTPQRRRTLLATLGVLSLLALSVASFDSYRDLRTGRDRELELQRQIADSERRIELLEQRVERLRHDPATIEQLAREELMMARPGEVVIVLPDEPAAGVAEAGEVEREAGGGG